MHQTMNLKYAIFTLMSVEVFTVSGIDPCNSQSTLTLTISDNCYLLMAAPTDLYSAASACDTVGLHLVFLETYEEQEWLSEQLRNAGYFEPFWIGASEVDQGLWKWYNFVTDVQYDTIMLNRFYDLSLPGKEASADPDSGGEFTSRYYSDILPYVCEKSVLPSFIPPSIQTQSSYIATFDGSGLSTVMTSSTTPTTTLVDPCNSASTLTLTTTHNCYLYMADIADLYTAAATCNSIGLHLVFLETPEEQAWLAQHLQNAGYWNPIWIGAKKVSLGEWTWYDMVNDVHYGTILSSLFYDQYLPALYATADIAAGGLFAARYFSDLNAFVCEQSVFPWTAISSTSTVPTTTSAFTTSSYPNTNIPPTSSVPITTYASTTTLYPNTNIPPSSSVSTTSTSTTTSYSNTNIPPSSTEPVTTSASTTSLYPNTNIPSTSTVPSLTSASTSLHHNTNTLSVSSVLNTTPTTAMYPNTSTPLVSTTTSSNCCTPQPSSLSDYRFASCQRRFGTITKLISRGTFPESLIGCVDKCVRLLGCDIIMRNDTLSICDLYQRSLIGTILIRCDDPNSHCFEIV